MRRLLLFCVFLLSVGVTSCQCSDPPEVGPVEEGDDSAALHIQTEEDASPTHL